MLSLTPAFKQHDVGFLAPFCKHHILAISESPLKFMGVEMKTNDEHPSEAFSSAIGKGKSHGVV